MIDAAKRACCICTVQPVYDYNIIPRSRCRRHRRLFASACTRACANDHACVVRRRRGGGFKPVVRRASPARDATAWEYGTRHASVFLLFFVTSFSTNR